MAQCSCFYEKHRTTTIQRIALFDTVQCSRKGSVDVVAKDGTVYPMCRTHARMAVVGFVDAGQNVMPKAHRSNYQQGKAGPYLPYRDLYTSEAFPTECEDFHNELAILHRRQR